MSSKQGFHDLEENKEKAVSQKLSPGNYSYLDFILAHNRTKPRVHFDLGSKNQMMQRIEETVKYTIGSRIPILITGEIGAGKTYLAKKIHKAEASLQKGSLLLIDCKDFQNRGGDFFKQLFSERNSSLEEIRTIVLKEVSFLDLTSQAYVLKFLQTFSDESSVGAPRLVATSSKDIYELVEKGLFQQDLYYRLYVLQLKIPSLMERKEDLEGILKELLVEMGKEEEFDSMHKKILRSIESKSPSFLESNVKSLKNFLEDLIFTGSAQQKEQESRKIAVQDFPEESAVHHWLQSIPKNLTMKDIETHIILEVLKKNRGNRTHTARSLGISLRTLRNKINEYLQKGYPVTKPQK